MQVPAPDLPVIVTGGPPEEMIVLVSLAVLATITILLWPVVRAWSRRLEGKGSSASLAADLDHLRDRVAELESVQHRVAELEERADFAERLLVQARDRTSIEQP